MSSGTKILLAVFALLIGGLMLYYSVLDDGTANPRVVVDGPDPSADPLNATPATSEPDPVHADPLGSPEIVFETDDVEPFDPGRSVDPLDPLAGDGMGALSAAVARSTDSDPAPGPRAMPPAVAVSTLPLISEPARPEPAVTKFHDHTVRSGETLSSIAETLLGAERRWREIAAANPDVDPHRLRVGQRLKIPAKAVAAPTRVEPAPPRAADGETWVVRPGDTLSSIAGRTLGDTNAWRRIYDANRRAIGGDPGRLKVGMRLVIPKR